MPLSIVRRSRGDGMKTRRRAVAASVAIVALAAMGLWVPFSGCKGDNAADDQSRGAAATGTDENAGAEPAGQSGTASAEALAEALRGVITEMLEETGADLSPEQVAAETEARYREGVEAVRRFYPEFLEETMPAGPETAEKRIAAVILVFGEVLATSPSRNVPIEAWLLQKRNAGQLDPVRTELLAQLLQGEFRRATSALGQLDESRRAQLASVEQTLFPGVPSEKLVPVADEARQCRDALKKIMMGMHNFHDVYRTFPGADRMARDQPPGLSWRVHILPYIEQKALYDEFELEEPWDSPHNRQLVERMPEVYKTPGVTQPGMTAIHVFVGEGTPFGGSEPPNLASIADGTANTLACVMAGPEMAKEWTRPGGIEFDPEAGTQVLGTPQLVGGVPVAFLDASTMLFPPEMPADMFSHFVTHQDHVRVRPEDVWDRDTLDRQPLWPFGDRRKPMGPAGKMKQLGLALHHYHDTFKRFPIASADAAKLSGLSWRVHILRFVDEKRLYEQFRLEEPWDSPHNLKLLDRMPDVYSVPGVAENKTVFHVFVGKGTPFGRERGPRLRDIRDGPRNTIMAVMGTPETAVEWTKPGGIAFDPAEPFRGLTQVEGGYPVLMMDGQVYLISPQTSPREMAGLVTYDGREVVSAALKPWH